MNAFFEQIVWTTFIWVKTDNFLSKTYETRNFYGKKIFICSIIFQRKLVKNF